MQKKNHQSVCQSITSLTENIEVTVDICLKLLRENNASYHEFAQAVGELLNKIREIISNKKDIYGNEVEKIYKSCRLGQQLTLQLRNAKQYECSLEVCKAILSLSISLKNNRDFAREQDFYFTLGTIYSKQKLHLEARTAYKKAFQLSQFCGPKNKVLAYITSTENLAITFAELGKRNKARKYALLCEHYTAQEPNLSKLGPRPQIVYAYEKIGQLRRKGGHFEESLDWFEDAFELITQIQKHYQSLQATKILKLDLALSTRVYSGGIDVPAALMTIEERVQAISHAIKMTREDIFLHRKASLLDFLKVNNIHIDCSEERETNEVIVSMPDSERTSLFYANLLQVKISCSLEKAGVRINLVEINTKYLYVLLKKYSSQSSETFSISPASQTAIQEIEDNAAYKAHKAERHALRESIRHSRTDAPKLQDAAGQEAHSRVEQSEIIWDDPAYRPYKKDDPENPYFEVYACNPHLRIFSFFSEKVIAEIPDSGLFNQFKRVAARGRVLCDGKTSGQQGYFFYKFDNNLTEKYGSEYNVKLKILGKEKGDHRVLGRTAVSGSKIDTGSTPNTHYKLIVFDKYVHKAHK